MATRNSALALNLSLIVLGMLALVAASVPLYRLFCQVTGYGGTTQQAAAAPAHAGSRVFTVTFNADTDPGLPWRFAPAEHEVMARTGQQALTHYLAENRTQERLTGHATYNVIPFSAGQYFTKIECFCFQEQVLDPGQKVQMPVLFFIDPAIENDPDLKDVKTITLSYTFFPVKNEADSTSKP